ncbi:MAG: DUF4838 domain-containing protein [Candidatus Pacebacteria bacterium]|nr:DUF4838 domain-containing protein [Candidatus Paceibacterota bacterium]
MAAQHTLQLTRAGQPEASIVIAPEASRVARFAALELRNHVAEISGVELPIVDDRDDAVGTPILVGDSSATHALGLANDDFESQEYLIRFTPDTIVLMGRDKVKPGVPTMDFIADTGAARTWPSVWDEQGTLYAVYDFLRDYCGVRWFNPTDTGTVCPSVQTLEVTGDEVRRKPFMWYRGGLAATHLAERIQWGGGLWRQGTPQGEKYMEMGYPRIYGAHESANVRNQLVRAQNRLFMLRHKAGGEMAPCNHSFYDYYQRFWDRSDPNFESYHPEYFAKGYEGEEPPQMCYTDEGFIHQLVSDIRDYFDHGGYQKRLRGIGSPGYKWGKNYFALEPMDNPAFCKCENCRSQYELDRPRAEQHSTYWFRFVNRIAREIEESHPDKKITTLAYMTHEGLPRDVKLEDNVIVYFCISANRMPYSPALDRQMELLKKWHENEDVAMSLWLYNTFPLEIANNGKFYAFPGFFAHALDKQFKTFEDYGINGIFHCGFNGEVANYLCYRFMDTPDADVDKLLDDYFSTFYGPAGNAIRNFYALVEQRYCDAECYPRQGDKAYSGHQNVRIAWDYLGTPDVMAKLREYMAEARAAAVTPEQKARVALWDQGVYQYMKAGHESYRERMSAPIPEVTATRVPSANGDPEKVEWNEAAVFVDKMYDRGSETPVPFKVDGRVCHDGEYLYIELVDHCDPEKLTVSPQISCYDDWEIMFARQRAQPFRQYLVGPTALKKGISYCEDNWRQGVSAEEYTDPAFGLKAASDTSGTAWILRLAFPLDQMLDKPVKPGDTIYGNLIRVRGPALNKPFGPKFGIESWVSYMTVKEVDRAGAITLAE